MKAKAVRPQRVFDWSLPLLFLLLAAGFFLLRIPGWKVHNPHDLMVPDSVEYAVSAYHLAQDGRIEVSINGRVHPLRFSFGYPLLIAAVYRVIGLDVENAVYASLFAGLCALALLFFLARRFFSPLPAVLAVLVLLSSGFFVYQSQTVMSDILSLALILAVLSLCLPIFETDSPLWGRWILLGSLLGYGLTVRSSMMFLFAAVAVLLLRAEWPWRKKGLFAAVVGLAVLPWAAFLASYNLRHFGAWGRAGYAYYSSNPYDSTRRLFSLTNIFDSPFYGGSNLVYYLKPMAFLFPEIVGNPAYAWTGCAVMALAVWGGWVFYRRQDGDSRARRNLVLFGLVWMGSQLLLYGVYVYREPTGRFFSSFLPFVTLFCVQGGLWLYERTWKGLAAALLLGLVGYRLFVVVDWNQRRQASIPESAFLETAHWFHDHTEPDAVIVSGFDGVYMDHYVTAGTERLYVPCGETVEYRSKYMSAKPPKDLDLIPADPLLSRYPRALENGAEEIIPYSAGGSPFSIVDLLNQKRSIYMDGYSLKNGFPEDYFVLRSIFILEPVAQVVGYPIFRLKNKFSDPREIKARYAAAWLYVAGKLAERGYWARAEAAARLALSQAPADPQALDLLATITQGKEAWSSNGLPRTPPLH